MSESNFLPGQQLSFLSVFDRADSIKSASEVKIGSSRIMSNIKGLKIRL